MLIKERAFVSTFPEAAIRGCSIKIVFLKNSEIFKEKHLCGNLFLIKLQAFSFPVNIAKFLRTSVLENIWERLLYILSGNIKEKKHKKNKTNETNQLKGITSGIGHFYIHILWKYNRYKLIKNSSPCFGTQST